MQIKSLRTKSYRSFRIDDTTPADAFDRLRRIETYQALHAEGCSLATALRAVDWPRATYFRWLKRYRSEGMRGLAEKSRRPRRTQRPRRTRTSERQVWAMRRQFPFMGKCRLRAMLDREGVEVGESTIGQILAIVRRQLPADWTARYNTTPVLIETFVEIPRYTGAVYRAAAWTHVGTTQRRGWYDTKKRYHKSKKEIWLRPLR